LRDLVGLALTPAGIWATSPLMSDYLGIEVDDKLAVAEQVDVGNTRAEETYSACFLRAESCQLRKFIQRTTARTCTA
jgi:hypothetical protein